MDGKQCLAYIEYALLSYEVVEWEIATALQIWSIYEHGNHQSGGRVSLQIGHCNLYLIAASRHCV